MENEATLWKLIHDGPGDDWKNEGSCASADPELFFAPDGVSRNSAAYRGQLKEAKAVCDPCPVRQKCLAEAILKHERFGIWGGMDEAERETLARRKNRYGRVV